MWRSLMHAAWLAGIAVAPMAYGDFLPPNNLHLEDNMFTASGITEQQFNSVIDKVSAIYAPIIQAQGGSLNVNRLWSDSTVNASASQFGGTWDVNMYGGLARRQEVTEEGFTLVMCHELGHHLAGYPFSSSWAADEGQSDYFATLSCAHLVWGNDTTVNASYRSKIPAKPKADCDRVWQDEEAQNLCYRTMMGGKSLADLLSALGGTTSDWNTPDSRQVSSTNHAHPAGQCRLDTYMAGALCIAKFNTALIPGKSFGSSRNGSSAEGESATVTCMAQEQYNTGLRPNCWFKSVRPN